MAVLFNKRTRTALPRVPTALDPAAFEPISFWQGVDTQSGILRDKTRAAPLLLQGTQAASASRGVLGYASDGSSAYGIADTTDLGAVWPLAFGGTIRPDFAMNPGSFQTAFAISNRTDASSNATLLFGVNTSGQWEIEMRVANGGTFLILNPSQTPVQGKETSWAFITRAWNDHYLWIDGALTTSSAVTTNVALDDLTGIGLGCLYWQAAGTKASPGAYTHLAAWVTKEDRGDAAFAKLSRGLGYVFEPERLYFFTPATGAVTATASVTEAADTLSATATVAIAATAAVTEAADTLSATATVALTATAAVTEAADTLSATAVVVGGTVATGDITEAADTLSATATVAIATTAAVTEAPDTLSASAVVTGGAAVTATAAITEAPDTLSATADNGVTPPPVTPGGGSGGLGGGKKIALGKLKLFKEIEEAERAGRSVESVLRGEPATDTVVSQRVAAADKLLGITEEDDDDENRILLLLGA